MEKLSKIIKYPEFQMSNPNYQEIKEFKTIYGNTIDPIGFDNQVNYYIKKGWQPFGQFKIVETTRIFMSMVRYSIIRIQTGNIID